MKNLQNNEEGRAIIFAMVRLADPLFVLFGGVIVYWIYFGHLNMPTEYRTALLTGVVYSLLVFPSMGMYKSIRGKNPIYLVQVITMAWPLVAIMLMATSVLLKNSAYYSRIWFGSWVLLTWVLLLLLRAVISRVLRFARKKGWNRKQVVIYGVGELGKRLEFRVKEDSEIGFDVDSYYDDNPDLHGGSINGIVIKGGIDSLCERVNNGGIQEIWVALPLRSADKVKDLIFRLRHSTVVVRYVLNVFGFRLFNHSLSDIAGIPVLDLNNSPMVGVNKLVKGAEDIILGFLILLLISPLMLLIAIAVKLDSKGPAIFKQRRHGFDGQSINVYKFRTMRVHQESGTQVTQAKKNDTRITRLGAFLRATSLDELPQFFNVLQGKMSIVGPRPHAISHNEEYKEQVAMYMQRHKVKPGITGWAQINGWRGETDTLYKMQKRIEHDLYYIENWSLFFDLKIIVATVFKGFIGKNVY
ncbi:MAG: undecaprenyl-phosphate glucose phosphotransferase [Bacteriovoracaceae bacterium]|nr:undecaprenyl-phosphate glucose phosphotransferase [Bacteriovoracaceae bacterium]